VYWEPTDCFVPGVALPFALQATRVTGLVSPHIWQYFTGDLQAVTGLHMTGVLHRDIKPDNMLVVNNELHLNDFDISCLVNSSDAVLQMRVGTEDFWSPLWQSGEPYKEVDDLASLVLSFAWLMNFRTRPPIERIRLLAELAIAAASLIDTAHTILRVFQEVI